MANKNSDDLGAAAEAAGDEVDMDTYEGCVFGSTPSFYHTVLLNVHRIHHLRLGFLAAKERWPILVTAEQLQAFPELRTFTEEVVLVRN